MPEYRFNEQRTAKASFKGAAHRRRRTDPYEDARSTFGSLGLPVALGAKGCRRSQAGDTTNLVLRSF